jgi:hypothetical protein
MKAQGEAAREVEQELRSLEKKGRGERSEVYEAIPGRSRG